MIQDTGKIENVILGDDSAGRRLDRVLADRFSEVSRAFIQECIREGRVLVDGTLCSASDKARAGSHVRIEWPAPEPAAEVVPEALDFEILYEDEDLLVVNKPANMTVHPNRNERTGTLVQGLLSRDEETFGEMLDETERPGIVHRLDKETSGALVVAKNMAAWHALKAAFKDRDVEKRYLTLVAGEFGTRSGRIENEIGRHPKNRRKMAVLNEGGKRAVSNYRVLGESRGVSFLEVRIETGRTHQIRVHFANLQHPVLGDHVYGGKGRDLPVRPKRQMLHAWRLAFPHPRDGRMCEFIAPLPQDFCDVLAELGLPVSG
jgi:23S rRNA pseudouridine1911/1915/1917 synthase